MKKNSVIMIYTILMCLLLLGGVMYLLFTNNDNEYKDMVLDFGNREDSLKNFDSGEFYKVGWIQVQGTNIDFVVLNSAIVRYADTFNNFQYAWKENDSELYNRDIISGHNLINVSSEPIRDMSKLSRFEALMLFTYDDFAKDNLYIKFTTNDGNRLYKIYAVGFYDDILMNSDNNKYVNEVKKNSLYKYDVDVNEDDRLLSLVTCTRYYGRYEKTNFVIDAREVRENEKIVKYGVLK